VGTAKPETSSETPVLGAPGGIIHKVSECATGARALAAAATTAAITRVFISSPSWSARWHGFAGGRAGTGIAGVSWTHQPHRCRRIADN
jgi:hypothetical protein